MPLIAAYAFNEGAGTTTAEASGGTPLTTVPAWESGRHGNALRLNLVNGPTIPAFPSNGDFTIMFDTRIDGPGNNNVNVLISGVAGEIGNLQQGGGNSIQWYPWIGPSGTTIATATWTHVAVVADGSTRRILVDGVEAASVANTELSGTNPFNLGGVPGYEPNIRIDNLRIYDEGLSNAQIAALAGTPVLPPTEPEPPEAGDITGRILAAHLSTLAATGDLDTAHAAARLSTLQATGVIA